MSSATCPFWATSTTKPAPLSSSAPTCWFRSLSSTSSTRAPAMAERCAARRGVCVPRPSDDRTCPPSACMAASKSCEGLTGLDSISCSPARSSSLCTSSRPAAVTMTVSGGCCRRASARWVSNPSMPGIFQSTNAISQGRPACSAARAWATASSPEEAVVTAKLMRASISPRICRACSLSSTTKTCRPRRSGWAAGGHGWGCPARDGR